MNSSWWEKTWLVAQREIRTRGKSRAYIITTVILLLAVAAGVVIPALLSHKSKPERVGIVDESAAAATPLVKEAGRIAGTQVTIVPEPSLATAEARLRSGDLGAVLVDSSQVLVKQVAITGTAGSLPAALANLAGLTKAFGHFPSSAGPTGLSVPVRGLEPPSASLTRRITGQITSILVLIIIQVYGQQISVGVAEEKQSRIVEVILASIRPIQLLTGKVLGIGLLAMVQAVAMVVVFLGLGTAVGSSLIHGAAPGIVATGAIFIVIGYAFYSTAYAAAGSLVTRQSELGSVVVPVVIPLIVAYALEFTVLYANTATTFYRVLGFLPPTAPVAMPVLYAAGDAPLWQVAVSAVLLAASTVWLARIAAAIYTRSILRTGTRIRLRQALRRETETEAPAVR